MKRLFKMKGKNDCLKSVRLCQMEIKSVELHLASLAVSIIILRTQQAFAWFLPHLIISGLLK